MADEPRPRLGRGLAALIGDARGGAASHPGPRGQRRIPVGLIQPNRRNPRKHFGTEQLEELVDSIRQRGVIQPILVRPAEGSPDCFELIAGERRWRAAQKAGVHDLPAVVVEASDRESLELAIVENVQRADLNALEEASGYEELMRTYKYTQADLAKTVGKSRSHVANIMRLLQLPESIRLMVTDGRLSAGHARALVTAQNPEAVARLIVKEGLSVREAERLAQEGGPEGASGSGKASRRSSKGRSVGADTRALERKLSEGLGLEVAVHGAGERGELRVRYERLEQLDNLCRLLLA